MQSVFKQLQQKLTHISSNLAKIDSKLVKSATLKIKLDDLTKKLDEKDIWNTHHKLALSLNKRRKVTLDKLSKFNLLTNNLNDCQELLLLSQTENDNDLLTQLIPELDLLEENVDKFFINSLLKKIDNAESSCFIEVNAGSGGHESNHFSEMLLKMYMKWAQNHNFKPSIIEETKGEVTGVRSAMIHISGPFSYGWCKLEIGVHRLVRISPYDKNGRRQTAFASINVFPDQPKSDADVSASIDINPADLKLEFMRAQGAGGQHVNKTDSAVRMTHMPTGITVFCQNERSQHQNKAIALKVIKAKILDRENKEMMAEKENSRLELPDNSFGSQIRSYVLQPYKMVKDLRSGYESRDVDRILEEGLIDGFLEANLIHFGETHNDDDDELD